MKTKSKSRTWIRRLLWAIAGLVTLITLFFAIENYRGAKAWERAEQAMRDAGETLDFDSLLPKPVPDAENYGANATLKGIAVVVDGNTDVGEPGELRKRIKEMGESLFKRESGEGVRSPLVTSASVEKGERIDLAAWAKYLAEGEDPLISSLSDDPAEDILAALGKFDDLLLPLEQGLDLPHAQLAPGMEQAAGTTNPFAIAVPHLHSFQVLTKVLALRAQAFLAAGRYEEAHRSSVAMIRLAEVSLHDPTLISFLVGVSQLGIANSSFWDALERRCYTADQLEELQGRLAAIDFHASYLGAARIEVAGAIVTLRSTIESQGIAELMNMMAVMGEASSAVGGIGSAVVGMAPKGWVNQNCATIVNLNLEHILTPLKSADPNQLREATEALEEKIKATSPASPYTIFARLMMPATSSIIKRLQYVEGSTDLMILACALERYYIDKGEYPAELSALAPGYVKSIPIDRMAEGGPLEYSPTSDGRYRIYSIGLNGTDDGGTLALQKKGRHDYKNGDWVWHYSPEATPLKK